MRKLLLSALVLTSLGAAAPAFAIDGRGVAIEKNYRYMREDRARLEDGRNAAAMAEGRANVEAWRRLREAQTGAATR